MDAIALSASSVVAMRMKPKPRDSRVCGSYIISAFAICVRILLFGWLPEAWYELSLLSYLAVFAKNVFKLSASGSQSKTSDEQVVTRVVILVISSAIMVVTSSDSAAMSFIWRCNAPSVELTEDHGNESDFWYDVRYRGAQETANAIVGVGFEVFRRRSDDLSKNLVSMPRWTCPGAIIRTSVLYFTHDGGRKTKRKWPSRCKRH